MKNRRYLSILLATGLAVIALALLVSFASFAAAPGAAKAASPDSPAMAAQPASAAPAGVPTRVPGKPRPERKARPARPGSTAFAADTTASEAPLNPDGLAYEVNRDANGDLWVSDDSAGEIWHVNPTTNGYTVYQEMSRASDARMDPAGAVWWADAGLEPRLGRIDVQEGTVTTWTVPTDGALWGVNFANGLVWVSDYSAGYLYSFAPSTTELCTYTLPDRGLADYVAAQAGTLWLGDWVNSNILKLNPASGASQFTSWHLPQDAWPEGLAVADNGGVWWADALGATLGHLLPSSNNVTTYTLPYGLYPEMVTLNGNRVWYSENDSLTLGSLDPALVAGESATVQPVTTGVTPKCAPLGNGTTSKASTRTGTLAWSAATYTGVDAPAGWNIYQLPPAASPWGVATTAQQLFAVDQGRQQLIRLPVPRQKVYLPYLEKH